MWADNALVLLIGTNMRDGIITVNNQEEEKALSCNYLSESFN